PSPAPASTARSRSLAIGPPMDLTFTRRQPRASGDDLRTGGLSCSLRGRNAEMRACCATSRGIGANVETMNATTSTPPITDTSSTRWTLDPGHSSVGFSVRHLMITNVRGEFERFRGDITYDPKRPEATRIEASIEVGSLNTREPKRDADLRGP